MLPDCTSKAAAGELYYAAAVLAKVYRAAAIPSTCAAAKTRVGNGDMCLSIRRRSLGLTFHCGEGKRKSPHARRGLVALPERDEIVGWALQRNTSDVSVVVELTDLGYMAVK